VRLLYHAATVKASGNVDNEGLIGVRGRIIVSASDGRTSSGNTRPTWDSSSRPPARSNGTTPSTSPLPFQDRGDREGGVVAATSRDTITQHI